MSPEIVEEYQGRGGPSTSKRHCPENQGSNLMESLGFYCLNDELSDFKINCGDKTFACHKLILGARSNVFKVMLETFKDGNAIIEEVDPQDMEALLRFMYTDHVPTEAITRGLLVAADKYNIQKLYNECVSAFIRKMNEDNFLDVLLAGHLVRDQVLMKEATKFVDRGRYKTITRSETWDLIKTEHPDLCANLLEKILFRENNPK